MSQFEISASVPTAIVHDFQTFMHYFSDKKVKLTEAGFLSGKICHELNEQMTEPQTEISSRKRHFNYHKLYLFYLLASNGQLLSSNRKGKSVHVKANLDQLDQFFSFSDTEQYMALLEILWMQTDWDQFVGHERPRSPARTVHLFLGQVAALNYQPELSLSKEEIPTVVSWDLWPFVGHLEFFGFWELDLTLDEYLSSYNITQCRPSKFGIEIVKILSSARRVDFWNEWEKRFAGNFGIRGVLSSLEAASLSTPEDEVFIVAFQSLFPKGELEKSILITAPPFQGGTYIFKLSFEYYPEVWRRVSLSGEHTLDELHFLIQKAVDFGGDHMYAFYLNNKLHSRPAYEGPDEGTGLAADSVKIGDLSLIPQKPFIYFFDFGASWQFEIILEKIDTASSTPSKPSIIESHGTAPQQYEFGDEEEDDDW